MATLQRKNVNAPDETRSFPHGSFNIVRLGDFAIANNAMCTFQNQVRGTAYHEW
jgi:hypothetical protein